MLGEEVDEIFSGGLLARLLGDCVGLIEELFGTHDITSILYVLHEHGQR
jgi:hypothetical protein